MLREITLGQYYPTDSVIHKLDPRVKLFAAVMFVISLFIARDWGEFAVATIFLVLFIKLSRVPFRYMVKGLRSIFVIMMITSMFNLFMSPGKPLVTLGIFAITANGIFSTLRMVVRLFYLILGTSVVTLCTTPNQLTDGLEKSLRPLQAIRVPVHEIAMMMSIAMRFIPILVEEADKIMKAQIARGADFESGNLLKRARNMVPLLVPLFVSAFRRAFDLAQAMEARCYQGGAGRTKMKPLRYQRRDGITYLVLLFYLTAVILVRIWL